MEAPAPDSTARQIATFYALACAFSWTLWLPLAVGEPAESLRSVLLVVGTFGPSVAALALLVARHGPSGTRDEVRGLLRWRLGLGWWAVALLGPVAIILAGIGVAAAAGAEVTGWSDPEEWYLVVPVFAYVVLFGGPLGEELGWRGWALPRLQSLTSPVVASLGIGAAWSLWHWPLFLIEGTVQQSTPVAAFVLQIVLTSVVYTWLWNHTASLPVVIGFHAAFNTAVGVFPILPETAGTAVPLWSAIGIGSLAALALIAATRGRLGRRPGAAVDPPHSGG